MSQHKPTDFRAERKRMERTLGVAVVVFLVIVGSLGIALAYGSRALILGTLCLVVGALLFGLVWGILTVMEKLVGD